MENAAANFFTDFKRWLEQPFDTKMTVLGWFLFFGLLILISFVWGFILSKTFRGE